VASMVTRRSNGHKGILGFLQTNRGGSFLLGALLLAGRGSGSILLHRLNNMVNSVVSRTNTSQDSFQGFGTDEKVRGSASPRRKLEEEKNAKKKKKKKKKKKNAKRSEQFFVFGNQPEVAGASSKGTGKDVVERQQQQQQQQS